MCFYGLQASETLKTGVQLASPTGCKVVITIEGPTKYKIHWFTNSLPKCVQRVSLKAQYKVIINLICKPDFFVGLNILNTKRSYSVDNECAQ